MTLLVPAFLNLDVSQKVISFTVIQAIRPVFISTGEFINQFYVGLSKDLNMVQSAILSVFISTFGFFLIVFLSIVLVCNEVNILHLFTIKKNRGERPTNESELRTRLTNEIINQLAVELPSEFKILKKIEHPSVEDLKDSFKLYMKVKEDEIKTTKDAEIRRIFAEMRSRSDENEIKSLGFSVPDTNDDLTSQMDEAKPTKDFLTSRKSEVATLSFTNESTVESAVNVEAQKTVQNMKTILSNLEFEDIDYVLDDEY